MEKTLSELVQGVNILKRIGADVSVTGIQFDSRKVKKGDLFFCISGFKTDGHDYAETAIEKGAAALMVTRKLDINIPQILVEDDRLAMALISCNFFNHPSRRLKMIGVTGTNGKTTITYMIKAMLEACGKKTGLVGTIHNMIGDQAIDTARTTPEAPDLNRLLKRMADEGCEYLVIEVSSHSLDLKRVAGINFDVGIFTNLTQDHLDFHDTFEAYAEAKAKLFNVSKHSIINVDDALHKVMLEASKGDVRLYGIEKDAGYKAKGINVTPKGIGFDYFRNGKLIRRINMKLTGYFNAYNALSALAAADALGLSFDSCVAGLEKMEAVDGRCQVLDTDGKAYSIILDYAHTPDSLENTIASVRRFATGRIITVVGCGGDRDKGKRPIMGEISGRLSDFTIVTSDNPRTEDPIAIIKEILPGIKASGGQYTIIENRRQAIKAAMKAAKKDDVIILAGKGHETYQEINGVKYDFDEKVVVKEILKELDAE